MFDFVGSQFVPYQRDINNIIFALGKQDMYNHETQTTKYMA